MQRRLVRFTFGAELNGLVDSVEQLLWLQFILYCIYINIHIYIYIYTYIYMYIYIYIYIAGLTNRWRA